MNNNNIYEVEKHINPNSSGIEFKLSNPWIIWINYCKDSWDNRKLIPVYKFSTIAGFWSLINNIKLIENQQIIFMREGIEPLWEDKNHINGGYCGVNLSDDDNNNEIFISCLLGIIGETFCDKLYNSLNITGITYMNYPKKSQLKIWTNGGKLNNEMPLCPIHISTEYLDILSYSDNTKKIYYVSFNDIKKSKNKNKDINRSDKRKYNNDRYRNTRYQTRYNDR